MLVGQFSVFFREAHDLLLALYLRQTLVLLIEFEQVPDVVLQGDGALHEIYVLGLIQSRLDVKESVHVCLVENRLLFVLAEQIGTSLKYRQIENFSVELFFGYTLAAEITTVQRNLNIVEVRLSKTAANLKRLKLLTWT